MTNNQIALIKEALLEEDLREMAIIDALPDEEIVFSEKYKTEMQKLLNKHKKYTRNANRFIPKRLVGVLAAILITLTLMMSISAIREPVVKFIVNVYENFISIFVEEDDSIKIPEIIEEEYTPSYMIEGYILEEVQNYDVLRITTWYDNDNKIELCQQILKSDFKSVIDKENVTYTSKNTKINTTIYYIKKGNEYSVIWSDGIYFFNLLCPNTIEITEVEKIIESMEAVED